MRLAAAVLITLLQSTPGGAVAASPDPRSSAVVRCRKTCERLVKDAEARALACNRCLQEGGKDRGCWVLAMESLGGVRKGLLSSVLADPDWMVRWAGVRAMAHERAVSEHRQLATYVMEAPAGAALPAMITAVHVAGAQGKTVQALLSTAGGYGPSAAGLVWQSREAIRKQMEVELYAPDPDVQREALVHLSVFLAQPPARTLLTAMSTRAVLTDGIAAAALLAAAEREHLPAGLALMNVARPGDEPLINRLFAVYSAELDKLRPGLTSPEAATRAEAVRAMGRYGPLASGELERLLFDPEPAVRLAAAKAVARGEGRGLVEAARARLASASGGGEQVARWLEVVGSAGEPGCDSLLRQVLEDGRRAEPLRAAALAHLGECGGRAALPLVLPHLSSRSARLRAAAVGALATFPRSVEAEQAAAKALRDPSPEVLAAAARTVAAQGQRVRAAAVASLASHKDARVRQAAVEGLGTLADPAHARPVAERLKADPSAAVRAEAARALGVLGGPQAAAALTHALSHDRDARVQYLAKESLRRLGLAP